MKLSARRLPWWFAGALTLCPQALPAAPPPVSDETFRVIASFYEYDAQVPLDARVVKRIETETFAREKVVFVGSRGDRVPAWLMLPASGKGPFPVALILDGWTGTKDRWWDDDTWPQGGRLTKALAAAGIAALVLDPQFHGERTDALEHQPVDAYVCPECPNARREMTIETVADYRRALDYVATRPEVDRSRVGAIGFSMGGLMTFALAAVDDRVKAAVACVTPISPKDPKWTVPAIAPATFAPRVRIPVLQLMGRTDELYTQAEAEAFRDALGSSQKPLEWFDAGHRLPPEYVPRAVAWFKARLQ